MAKTAKVKKREVSLHSRAARRNATPPPKVGAAKPPAEETDYKPWLHGAQNAGISKKPKKKVLTRQQRVRQQRGIEKGEEVVEKLEKKVEDSKKRSKRVQLRAVDWEELNEKLEKKKKADEAKKAKKEKIEDGAKPMDDVMPELAEPQNADMADVEEDVPAAVAGEQGAGAGAGLPEDDEVL